MDSYAIVNETQYLSMEEVRDFASLPDALAYAQSLDITGKAYAYPYYEDVRYWVNFGDEYGDEPWSGVDLLSVAASIFKEKQFAGMVIESIRPM